MKTGAFGDGMWILYDDGTMLVSADEGPGSDYEESSPIKLGFYTGVIQDTDPIVQTKRIEVTGNITELNMCFNDFKNLESVSLGPSVKTLNATFMGCEKLSSINLDGIETIGGNYTFGGTAMKNCRLEPCEATGQIQFRRL